MLRTGGPHGLPGSCHKIRAQITACSEQTPRPGLSWLPSAHFPSLSHRQTCRSHESPQKHGNAARCHTARSSPLWMPPWPQVAHQRTETAAVQLREASPFILKIPKTQEWPSSSPGLWVGFLFRAQATWYYSMEKEHGPFWGWCLNWSLPNKRERGQDLPFVTDMACAGVLPTGCVLSVALRGQHH